MAAKTEKPKEAGFRIGGIGDKGLFFPLVPNEKWKQGDIALVEAVTGKDWDAWIRLLNKHGLAHASTKIGYFAVSLQRARDASVEDVVEFINELPLMDGIVLEFPDAPKEAEEGPTKEDDVTEASET
jgi:hypothetical protein